MCLKQADIFNPDDSIKQNAFIHDKKTGKPNILYLKPVQTDLLLCRQGAACLNGFFLPSNTQNDISQKNSFTKLWAESVIYQILIT